MDLILKRSKEMMCPICKYPTIKSDVEREMRIIQYQGQDVLICKRHHYLKKEVKKEK